MSEPKRGEIWVVDLNPTRGQEIQKARPAIVISRDLFEQIPLRIIVSITSWQPKFEYRPFMVRISASAETGLLNESASNTLQVRSISIERFSRCLGRVPPAVLAEILAEISICIDE
ncbi:MAG: PemK family transcriptional regulator [Leptolyngbya sp. ERB_1_1]